MIDTATVHSRGESVNTAVIILFHGSRAEGSGRAVKRIIADIRKRDEYDIVCEAYLQYGSPRISDAVDNCVKQHAENIVIVPFFMQPGAHVTRDIPAFIQTLKKKHLEVEIMITDFVGAHPLMTDIVMDLVKKSRTDHGMRSRRPKGY
jgi:sirohydrochlorin ferrochelatase